MSITQTEFSTNIDKYIILSQTEDVYVVLDDNSTIMLGKPRSEDLKAKNRKEAAKRFLENPPEFTDDFFEAIEIARKNEVPQERNWL